MKESINLAELSKIKHYSTEYSNLGEEYIFTRITRENLTQHHADERMMRFDGISLILCVKGRLSFDINLMPFDIEDNTLVVAKPGSILRFKEAKCDDVDLYVLFISPTFMRDLNFDLNILSRHYAPDSSKATIKLSNDETALLCKYLELLHLNTKCNTNDIYTKSIARCLIASTVYQMMQFSIERNWDEPVERPRSRRVSYVQDFMRLVHIHHKSERSIGFYADKLFISPKYLSLIIKESTGRSAAEWIDEYVILEAKNMLRFSGKNVQQIAYDLNFSNQSSFGKYFKHLTGMSPTEFQRS